jgi:NADPH-dependent 2,4-dienoyl-CoA reductase/sulfur reductase-like enzyme
MDSYTYIIIGGGMTAYAALKGIREVDAVGTIGLFSTEAHLPYKRPPLSKSLWTGKKTLKDIWLNVPQQKIEYHFGCQIVRLDPTAQTVEDQEGGLYHYDRLLLATGGRPRRLSFSVPGIIYFRTLDDYQVLRAAAGPGRSFAVIGGGFIGSEISAALQTAGSQVIMIFPEAGVNSRLLPAGLARYLNDYYQEKGVTVLAREMVAGIQMDGDQYRLRMESGIEVRADGVIAGIGLQPNIGLAEAAGLQVGDGIFVDPYLQASQPNIFAAGDAANFYAPILDRRLRVEHEDNALSMGRLAGKNMAESLAGQEMKRYEHLPYFYSDMFDLGYEAVGLVDSRLETVEEWLEPYQQGIVYYLDGGIIRGVLLWNVWDKLNEARDLLGGRLEQAVEIAR